MQTNEGKTQTREFKYYNPYNPNENPKNVSLSLNSEGWKIWEAIKGLKGTIANWTVDNNISRL